MKFEKFFNSKFYKVLELIYRLIITNLVGLLAILLGLGIFSLMSAIISMVIIVKSISTDTEFPLVTVFINSFKKNYKRVLPLSFFYLFLIALSVFNLFFFYVWFNEVGSLFYEVAFNFSIFILLFVLAMFINACFVYVYFPNLTNWKVIKYSFTLFRVTIIQFILMIIFLVGLFFLVYTIPLLVIFIYISLGLYLINYSLKNTYRILVVDGVESLNAFMYK